MLFVSREVFEPVVGVVADCFNLGIEMLFVSRFLEFRSASVEFRRFNLGIEMLFVSRLNGITDGFVSSPPSFNLGIEMLFVSSAEEKRIACEMRDVSISESRCFSFQVG